MAIRLYTTGNISMELATSVTRSRCSTRGSTTINLAKVTLVALTHQYDGSNFGISFKISSQYFEEFGPKKDAYDTNCTCTCARSLESLLKIAPPSILSVDTNAIPFTFTRNNTFSKTALSLGFLFLYSSRDLPEGMRVSSADSTM